MERVSRVYSIGIGVLVSRRTYSLSEHVAKRKRQERRHDKGGAHADKNSSRSAPATALRPISTLSEHFSEPCASLGRQESADERFVANALPFEETDGIGPPVILKRLGASPQPVTRICARCSHHPMNEALLFELDSVTERTLRQAKPWRGSNELKLFVAGQRVRSPSGKGAARMPEASLVWWPTLAM